MKWGAWAIKLKSFHILITLAISRVGLHLEDSYSETKLIKTQSVKIDFNAMSLVKTITHIKSFRNL